MSNQFELPHFKYIPNAFELGLFSKETFTCEICNSEQNYRYVGPVYMENENSTGTFKVTAEISNFGLLKIKGTDSTNRCIVKCAGACFKS